ncbi:MAG: hypothetical protein IPQ18_09680 [Saprospiraceae bacterium]|nr:hypothetical protein [Saprospiraceae bacterium]
MIASLGLAASNSTQAVRYFNIPAVISHSEILTRTSSSTTRSNNSERFSLEQLKSNKRKLDMIKNLGPNWNGYEGKPFETRLISKIQEIISDLDYQPQIFPTGRGTIQIEKYINDDNLIEIEVSNEQIFAYQVKNGEEIEKEISLKEINELITELFV